MGLSIEDSLQRHIDAGNLLTPFERAELGEVVNRIRLLQAANIALRAELAAAKRIPDAESLNPGLLVKSLVTVNAINGSLETELATERAKVAKGVRFREWLETRWGSELFAGLVGSWEALDTANNPSK